MKGIESMWNDHWSIMKPAYFIIWFSFNINFIISIKWYSRAQKVIQHKYVKYTCSMETVQQNGRFTLFSSKFHSNIFHSLWPCTCYTCKPSQRNKQLYLLHLLETCPVILCCLSSKLHLLNKYNSCTSFTVYEII